MKKLFIFLTCSLGLFCCDYYDSRLEVQNNGDNAIAVEVYEDTVATLAQSNQTRFYLENEIGPKSKKRLTKNGKNGWPFTIVRSKNKKLNIAIFRIDSLKKYNSLDYLIKNKKYEWLEFTEEQLNEQNWRVVVQ